MNIVKGTVLAITTPQKSTMIARVSDEIYDSDTGCHYFFLTIIDAGRYKGTHKLVWKGNKLYTHSKIVSQPDDYEHQCERKALQKSKAFPNGRPSKKIKP
jgi:hypothetical protein